MQQLKLDILKKGGNLYYSDTDSIVTDKALPNNLVDSNKSALLKLEHLLKEGIFISNKLYLLKAIDPITNEIRLHIKAKGVNYSFLSELEFRSLLADNNVKTISKTYWEKGYVEILDKNKIRLSRDSFTKREKVFNSSKLGVNTKPVIINEIDKSLIVYKNMTSLILYKNVKVIYFRKLESGTSYKELLITWGGYGLLYLAGFGYVASFFLIDEDSFEVPFIPNENEGNDINENLDNKKDSDFGGNREINSDTKVNNNSDSTSLESRDLDYLKEDSSFSTFDSEIMDPRETNKPSPFLENSLLQGFEEELAKIKTNKLERKDSSNTAISPLTPTSLPDLEEIIKRNQDNLENLDKIFDEQDSILKDAIKERLIAESKHLSGEKDKILSNPSSENSDSYDSPDYDKINQETDRLMEKNIQGLREMTSRMNEARSKLPLKKAEDFKSDDEKDKSSK